MSEPIDGLLSELEELSTRVVELAAAADTVAAEDLITQRGAVAARLKMALETAVSPCSYSDWNRLVVVHAQGNQIQAHLAAARTGIAMQLIENAREQALLECMSGVMNPEATGQLDELG